MDYEMFKRSLAIEKERENLARTYTCPFCGAPPKQGCDIPNSSAYRSHMDRYNLAMNKS
jgi:transcription elongation factor Elf1